MLRFTTAATILLIVAGAGPAPAQEESSVSVSPAAALPPAAGAGYPAIGPAIGVAGAPLLPVGETHRSAVALAPLLMGGIEESRRRAAPSLSRHLAWGGGIGGLLGAAFGMAVISIADCSGQGCTAERVFGVASLSLGGAAIGALVGGAVYLIRR